MECDSRLIQVKGALEGFDGGSISSYVSEANTAFSSLGSCFGSVSDTLSGAGIWQDVVATSFGSNIESIKSSMESLKSIPPSVEGVSGMVSGLVSTIEKYENIVESYNSMESRYNNLNVGSRPSKKEGESVSSYNSRLSAYNGVVNEKNQLKLRMDKAKEAAETLKDDSYSQLNAIDGMMGGSGSFAPAAGGGGGVGGRSEVKTETDADGNKTTRTIYYDDNDKKISEDYNIVDKDGKEVEKGSKTFYDNGNVKTWKYDSDHEEDPSYPDHDMYDYVSVKNKEVVYRPDGTIERESAEEVILKDSGGYSFGVIKDVKRQYNEDGKMIHERIERYESTFSDTEKFAYDGMEYNYEDGVHKNSYEKYEHIDENNPEAYEYSIGYLLTIDEEGTRHEFIKEGKEYDPYFRETVSYEEFEEIKGYDKDGNFELLRHYDKFEKSDGTIYENVNSKLVGNDGNKIYETKASEIAYQDGKKEKNVTEIVDLESIEKPLTERKVETTYNTDGSVSHGTHEKYEAKLDEEGHRTGDVKVSETIDETKYKDGTKAQNIERKYDNEKVVEEKTGRIYRAGGGTVVNETKTYNEDGSIERHVDAEDATGMGIDIKYDATTTYNEDGSYTETIGSHANRGDSITNETIRHNEDGNVTQYYQEENQHNDFSKDTGVNVHYDENGQFKSVDIESHTDNEKGIFGQTVEERDIHKEYDDGAITHEESDTVGQIGGIDVINFHNEKDYKTQNT